MNTPHLTNHKLKLYSLLFLALFICSQDKLSAQSIRTWSGATGSAWLTTTNWSSGGIFAGGAPLANPTGEGANNDILAFAAANGATNVGINMNTLTAGAGGVGLILGGIDFNKTNTATVQIGNSSPTVNGIMQINGATINSVANTLIRVDGSANLTIANVNTGTGTQTMGLRLGSTNGIFEVITARTLTISSNISEAAASSGFTKTGAGTLILGGTNNYTGTTTVSGGTLSIATVSNLPGALNMSAAGTALTITGTTTTLSNDITLGAVTGNITLNTPTSSATTLSGIISGGSASTVLFFQGGGTSQNTGALTLSNNGNTFQGRIDVQRGPLILTAANAAGSATIRLNSNNPSAGALQIGGNFTITNAVDIVDAGETIGVATGLSAGISGNIGNSTAANGFQKVGDGTLTLSGVNTHAGTTDIQAGILAVSGGSAISDIGAVSLANIAGAAFQLNASETVASIAGGGTAGGNITLGTNTLTIAGTASTSFSGVLSGTGGQLTKNAASTCTLTLTGTNTYTGGTNLNGGALNINNSSSLGSGALTVGTTATGTFLQVANNAAMTLANSIVLPNPITAQRIDLIKNTASASTGTQINLTGDISGGSSNLTLRVTSNTSGDNTTSYRFAGNSTFSGKVELFRGAILIASPTALGTATLQLNGNNNTTLGDLRFESSMTFANNIELVNTSNPDPIHTNGNTVVLSGVISSTGDENLVKIGPGTLVLTGANTYTVGTTISGGTVEVATVAASSVAQPLGQSTSAVTLSGGGRLNYTGVGTSWNRGITVTTGSTGIIRNSGSGELTLTGPISKDGSTLTFSGTQPIKVGSVITGASANSDLVIEDTTVTLANANTYNGPTTVNNGGKLAVTNTTGSATSTGNVQANSGSVILGTGFIQPASGGTVTISSGAKVSVGNASGDTTGKILTFTPASGSITTFFQSGSTLELDLFSGAGLGDQTGNLAAADLFRTGGIFDISTGVKLKVTSSLTGFAANDKWRLLDWNTLAGTAPIGTFDTALFELPALTGMLGWDLSQLYTAGTISVAVVPEPTRVLLLAFGLVGVLIRRRR